MGNRVGATAEGRRRTGVWQLTALAARSRSFGGDANVPSKFVFPTATALSLGFREGEPTGANGPIMLRFKKPLRWAREFSSNASGKHR